MNQKIMKQKEQNLVEIFNDELDIQGDKKVVASFAGRNFVTIVLPVGTAIDLSELQEMAANEKMIVGSLASVLAGLRIEFWNDQRMN